MSYLERANAMLEAIRADGRYRSVELRQLEDTIDFSSNDYLALATDRTVLLALRNAHRVGSGGARLLGGRHREHSLLEEELAAWLGRERALLFSSGYHAALGAIAPLSRTVDAIYSDALNHASLIDGIRLAHAPRHVYPHRALPPREERSGAALIVTESVFGMDGDAAGLRAMLDDLGPGDVLLVDEAHALGVCGPQGAGLARELDDPRVVVLGTLSKAFGSHGGFVAGPAAAIELLTNAARTFIFDTALPPALALAARVALTAIRSGDDARRRVREAVARTRLGLRSLGIDPGEGPGAIVPVVLGSEERTLAVAGMLLADRIYAPGVRPPTVPPGSSRLRISLRADHTLEHVDLLIASLQKCIATS
jgi:8-amino-7-oxononanoate synthase